MLKLSSVLISSHLDEISPRHIFKMCRKCMENDKNEFSKFSEILSGVSKIKANFKEFSEKMG